MGQCVFFFFLLIGVQIANLKKSLKNVALGKAFVLQGGMVFAIDIVDRFANI